MPPLRQYLQQDTATLQTKTNCWSEALFVLNTDRIGCITLQVTKKAKYMHFYAFERKNPPLPAVAGPIPIAPDNYRDGTTTILIKKLFTNVLFKSICYFSL